MFASKNCPRLLLRRIQVLIVSLKVSISSCVNHNNNGLYVTLNIRILQLIMLYLTQTALLVFKNVSSKFLQ